MKHELKTWPEPFAAVLAGRKTYEIRSCIDRDFTPGDELVLREWQPAHPGRCDWKDDVCTICKRQGDEALPGTYTGRQVSRTVTHVTGPGEWGLNEHTCVMAIQKSKASLKPQIVCCTDCGAEHREPYEGQSELVGWIQYYESDSKGRRVSPLIRLCSPCADKPFKIRYPQQ